MKLLIVILSLLVCGLNVLAQPITQLFYEEDYTVEVSQWTAKTGLPTWLIFDLSENKQGYIWLATERGLVRFDGREFTTYNEKKNGFRVSSTFRAIEDVNGLLWVFGKTRDSKVVIDVFDPILEQAVPLEEYIGTSIPLSIKSHLGIYSMAGALWILDPVTRVGGKYDGEWHWQLRDTTSHSEHYSRYFPLQHQEFLRQEVRAGVTYLERIDSLGNILHQERKDNLTQQVISVSDDYQIWFPMVNPTNSQIERIGFCNNNGKFTHSTPLSEIKQDLSTTTIPQSFHFFLGSKGVALQYENSKIQLYEKGKALPFDLGQMMLDAFKAETTWAFWMTENNAFWFRSAKGLFRVLVRPKIFRNLITDEGGPVSFRGILPLSDSTLIANTYKGSRLINTRTGTNERIHFWDDLSYISGKGFLKQGDDLWITGHFNFLIRYSLSASKAQNAYNIRPGFPEYDGTDLLMLGDTLLIGSHLGLLHLRPGDTVATIRNFPDTTIHCFYKNFAGIWLGTGEGLQLLDHQGKALQRFDFTTEAESLPKVIFHIHEDREGFFWMATNQGLLRWSPFSTKPPKIYTVVDGLSNNKLHAVYEDKHNQLWLPSNYGLMRMDKTSGQITTYYKEDGLPDSEFNQMSHFQDKEGRLYFGTIDGLCIFHPDSLAINASLNQEVLLQISKVVVYERNTETPKLNTKQVIETGKIRLNPQENRVIINLTPNYLSGREVAYEWCLANEGMNWRAMSSPSLELSNFSYGRHKLRIRAYSIGNALNDQREIVISIFVMRPFYLRPWFIITMIGLLGLGLWWMVHRRSQRLIAANIKLKTEVENATKELRQLDAMKSRFFINISHELRTPLSMILGPVTSLSKQAFPPDQMSQLQRIKRSTKQLRQMVEEILDLARLEAGKLELREEVVLFSPFIRRVVNTFDSLAESRNIVYELELDAPENLRIKLDTQKVERILNNLISNALKFTGREGRVLVKASAGSEVILLAVEDTGLGINDADLNRVFDRYYQARHQGNMENGGLGIGLALCKELTAFLGGQLEVESELGKGSIFFLSLPISVAEESLLELKTNREQDVLKRTRLLTLPPPVSVEGQPTVLIVEDNDDFRAYLLEILRPYFRLVYANDGLDALEVLNQQEVDLVVSDVMMPRMDGFELLKSIRSKPQQWGLPFILLTARSEQADQLYGLRLGVDTYLSKPFEQNELIARIHNLLDNQQKRKAAFEGAIISEREKRLGSTMVKVPALSGPSFDELWLIDLEALLTKHIREPQLKVRDLARDMAMSERSFRDKLISCTGLKPSQYILQARLQLAYRLLEDKRYPTIAELTYAIGLQSTAYFSKSFKSFYGKSPSEMMK
ncbi:response regulator [Lewinella sp. LCG006]|uniref:hybrid sensor histidine kinase/response regulator transcription factor n=1 Tax=Lewinella sp. LCG006 TaxID=3231911 RepID=UPI00345F95B9